MHRSLSLSWLAVAAMTAPLSGCFLFGQPQDSASGSSANTTTEQDVKEYDATQKQLERARTPFLPDGAAELTGVGTRLFYLDFSNASPKAHSVDVPTDASVDYKFSIGDQNTYNVRLSEDLVVTAEIGSNITYHAYDAASPDTEVGSFELPAPGDGVKWWAYAPDHSSVYVMYQGDGPTQLKRWDAGSKELVDVLTLEDIGIDVGEFWDFGVDSGHVVLIESGRLWAIDLTTKKPTFLKNTEEAYAGLMDMDGVLYEAANGPFYFDYATNRLTDVGAAIKASKYELNSTFPTAHWFEGHDDGTSLGRLRDNVAYIASEGVYAYDLSRQDVRPILLNARDNSVVYTSPVVLSDGSVFVKSLTSNDGAIGFDGPVYRVDFVF